ncbi:MAG: efflux RND transporter periplasmic adaptor subunit [Sphingomonadales bacterium]|nr:efflux RND transporter periplasmic adaptor subunit [Sphingomonadales bacterium]MDE2170113.1 efflux RND transporter periplasmic adaptor subunit [Sphingomonadales bacterium]
MSDTSEKLLPETITPPSGLGKAAMIAGGVAVLVVGYGLFSRNHADVAAQSFADAQAEPTVHLIAPQMAGKTATLVLPGTMQAWNSARIFARVGGYVRSWDKDIGAQVGAGTPLGYIDTPELDQQIIEARATLMRTKAQAALAKSTAARWNDLLTTNSVSHQEADEKNAGAATATATVAEAQASLGRLLALKSYATVRAPFAGIVTSRNSDIGDLVGPGSTNPQPMFSVADLNRIRIYVNVPQQYSAQMKAGQTATLNIPEAPGQELKATVLAQANAINPQSGALQVQLVTDNPTHLLKPGGYAQVTFSLPSPVGLTTVPSGALILRGGGTRVATVTPGGRIHLIPVTVGRDMGATVQITSGLPVTTKIVEDPTDSIAEGQKVRIGGDHG